MVKGLSFQPRINKIIQLCEAKSIVHSCSLKCMLLSIYNSLKKCLYNISYIDVSLYTKTSVLTTLLRLAEIYYIKTIKTNITDKTRV